MANRRVSAFGPDSSSESSSEVTSGKGPARGVQKDATPSKSDEPGGRPKGRQHRAWGYLPRFKNSPLANDPVGSPAERQARQTGEFMTDGGNSAGRSMKGVDPYFVDSFQGRSGQPDNQSTNRGKGST